MSATSHTAEPWEFVPAIKGRLSLRAFIRAPREGGMPYALEVAGEDYTGYGDDERREADLQRIVACVNACADMDDPAKEIDDLRSALREAIEMMPEGGVRRAAWVLSARALIAKVQS